MSLTGAYRLILPAGKARLTPQLSALFAVTQINGTQFLTEFNNRTAYVFPNVHIRVKLLARSDKTFTFTVGTPEIVYFLRRIARIKKLGAGWQPPRGNITLREVYHLALVKSMDSRWMGRPLPDICKNIMHRCHSCGIAVTKELLPRFLDRDSVPVEELFGPKKQEASGKSKAVSKKKGVKQHAKGRSKSKKK